LFANKTNKEGGPTTMIGSGVVAWMGVTWSALMTAVSLFFAFIS